MKYKNILRAQRRHEGLCEEIRALQKEQGGIREQLISVDYRSSSKILSQAISQIDSKVDEKVKERDELEV